MEKSFQSLLGLMLLLAALATAAQITKDDYVAVNSSENSNEIKIKGKEQAALQATKKMLGMFCRNGDRLFFSVGKQSFVAPRDSVIQEGSMLQKLSFSADLAAKEVEFTITKDLGCREKPVPYVFAAIATNNNKATPLLIMVRPEVGDTSKYIHHLLRNKLCSPSDDKKLAICTGSRTDGDGHKVTLNYMIPLNSNGGINVSGAHNYPIHARCESNAAGKRICAVDEYFDSQIRVSLGIAYEDLSPASILAVRAQLSKQLNGLVEAEK
jgi:hypothetical protein